MVKVAFSKAVINDLWPMPPSWHGDRTYHDDVEARCMYFDGSDGKLLLISLDIIILSRKRDRILREEVAKRLNLSPEEVLVHCTHAHNNIPCPLIYLDKVAEQITKTTRPAMNTAQEAEMAFTYADVDGKFSVNRRKYVSDDLGVCTFWDGYRKEGNRADAAHLVEELKKALLSPNPRNIYWLGSERIPISGGLPKIEGLEPIWYDRPADPLVQLLVFRTENGEPLGSLLRFSTHVQAATFPLNRDKNLSSAELGGGTADFPHYTRERLEENLGGLAVYATGPASNVVPLLEEWTWNETRRYGIALADAALNEYNRVKPEFSPLTCLKVCSSEVDLPVHSDLPESVEEAKQRAALIREELKGTVASGAPLRQVKRMADLINHYEWAGVSWGGEEEVCRRKVSARITGVKLNLSLIHISEPTRPY